MMKAAPWPVTMLFALSLLTNLWLAGAPDWRWIPATLGAWYLADVLSGLTHMYMDYRPCTPGIGLDRMFHYAGSRESEEYLALRDRVLPRISPFERLVYDFKNHHPRPEALGRRPFLVQIGSTILFGQHLTQSDSGLLTLGTALGERYGDWSRILFLIGFLAVTSTSLLGVWNGVSLLFADWTRTIRGAERYEPAVAERSTPFRGYLLWLTIPPMALLFLDKPFALTLVYGVLGSVFMPFLAITLMLLLNSGRVTGVGRSGWLSNTMLGASSALFLTLLVIDLAHRLG